jgi:hypothetical protein
MKNEKDWGKIGLIVSIIIGTTSIFIMLLGLIFPYDFVNLGSRILGRSEYELEMKVTPTDITITYHANGGWILPSSNIYMTTENINIEDSDTLSLSLPTRTGWRFDGWRIQHTHTFIENMYDLRREIGLYSEITLVADWGLPNITVTYHANEGWISAGVYTRSEVIVGLASLSLPSPTREGYEFYAWRLYDTNYYIQNTTDLRNAVWPYTVVTLVATWIPVSE